MRQFLRHSKKKKKKHLTNKAGSPLRSGRFRIATETKKQSMSTWKMQDFTPKGTPDHQIHEIISVKFVKLQQQSTHPRLWKSHSTGAVRHMLQAAFMHRFAFSGKGDVMKKQCNFNFGFYNSM